MESKIRIYRQGKLVYETQGVPGEMLMDRIAAVGVLLNTHLLDAPCGGKGRCLKCVVRLGGPAGEEVLACMTPVDGDMDVYLPDEMDMQIAGAGSSAQDALVKAGSKLGVAVDIGTTTVVAHLTDIETGRRIATASGVNAQRQYGADVISRIQYCAENGHEALTRVIREQLGSLIAETCEMSGARPEDIGYIVIAANTIMQHLAADYSPVPLGVAPFTTQSLFGEELPAWEGLPVAQGAKIYYAPAISAYVGGDITAGMLASGLEDTQGPVVYLDIGTNGEIAMKCGGKYFCCATAAGPAFEGAEITMGMAAIRGAVNMVKWDDGLKFTVLGDAAPLGFCGSGLLDALAVLLETGAVDETGRMLDHDEIDHDIKAHITSVDGQNVFMLSQADGVYMSGADVRKLQLAKSAIAAGIQVLLKHCGVPESEVDSFVLAGGFGSFMDKNSAARIGLFPKCFLPITKTLGNTAGEGAAIALCSEAARLNLGKMREKCEYIELSSSLEFNEQFVENMMFDE